MLGIVLWKEFIMWQTITRQEYERFLSLAPTSVLEKVGANLTAEANRLPEESPESKLLMVMLIMLGLEYQMRQVEPPWRKAKRLTLRYFSILKQVIKIAARIAFRLVKCSSFLWLPRKPKNWTSGYICLWEKNNEMSILSGEYQLFCCYMSGVWPKVMEITYNRWLAQSLLSGSWTFILWEKKVGHNYVG